jgi:hypothetical protein
MQQKQTGKSFWSEDIEGERYYLHWLDATDVTSHLEKYGATFVPRGVCTKNHNRNWSKFVNDADEILKLADAGDLALFLESEYETYDHYRYQTVSRALKTSRNLACETTLTASALAIVEERLEWSKRSIRLTIGSVCFSLPLIDKRELSELLLSDPVLLARTVISDSPSESNLYQAIQATISLLDKNNRDDQPPGVLLNSVLPIFSVD